MAVPAPGEAASAAAAPGKRRARRRRTASRLFRFDRALGSRFVAGADEAGRGSLAGPLVAAAVLLDYARLTTREVRALTRLDDSKAHDIEQREALYPIVVRTAVRVAVTSRCVRGIDERGLHVTNLAALRDTLRRVAVPGTLCLVDGFRVGDIGYRQEAVVDGDARSAAIAAASVIAKVTRDRYMHRIADDFPGWDFQSHVGYSTPDHRATIAKLGITDLHRRSFQSIAYQQLAIEG